MSNKNYQDDSFPPHPGDVCPFAQACIKSKLLSVEDVANALVDIDAAQRQQDREVARHFIRTDMLTKWQAKLLLSGKTRGFFLGRYKLLKQLGEGGQGVVYLAEHTLMKRIEAVKYFTWQPRQGPANLGRLAREVTLSADAQAPEYR